jgi:hypothetical protein
MAMKGEFVEKKKKNTIPASKRISALIDSYLDSGRALDKDIVLKYPPDAHDRHDMFFEEQVRKRPATLSTIISAIYRVKDKQLGEFYFYNAQKLCYVGEGENQRFIAFDHDGYGYHRKPVCTYRWDEQKKERVPTITSYTKGYELKWDKEEVKKLLESSAIECENFYVGREGVSTESISDVKYTIINKQDFLEGDFDSLWNMGRLGLSYTESSLGYVELGLKKERENREANLGMHEGAHYG